MNFRIGYAKSGRSLCRQCNTKVAFRSLRISRIVMSEHSGESVHRWHHPACLFELTEYGEYDDETIPLTPRTTAELYGFGTISAEDQETISANITATTEAADTANAAANAEFNELCSRLVALNARAETAAAAPEPLPAPAAQLPAPAPVAEEFKFIQEAPATES
jgi:hypothetical protein